MAQIGLRDIYVSQITETDNTETYATPVNIAGAISADITINKDEKTLYADDGEWNRAAFFKDGSIKIGVAEIGSANAALITGATVDGNGALVSHGEDSAPYFAVGFKSLNADGKYQYIWLYRVKFSVPDQSYKTKGDSLEYSTPSVTGTFSRRKKADYLGDHPWRAMAQEGDTTVKPATLTSWFTNVYEPSSTATGA